MQTHLALMHILAGMRETPQQRILNTFQPPAPTRFLDNPDPNYHNEIDQVPWHNPFHPAGSQHVQLLAQALASNTNNPAVSYRNAMASRFLRNVAQ